MNLDRFGLTGIAQPVELESTDDEQQYVCDIQHRCLPETDVWYACMDVQGHDSTHLFGCHCSSLHERTEDATTRQVGSCQLPTDEDDLDKPEVEASNMTGVAIELSYPAGWADNDRGPIVMTFPTMKWHHDGWDAYDPEVGYNFFLRSAGVVESGRESWQIWVELNDLGGA